jgi:hypothetical protein
VSGGTYFVSKQSWYSEPVRLSDVSFVRLACG